MRIITALGLMFSLTLTFAPVAKPAAKIVVDTSDAPGLEAYGRKVKVLAEKWYPIIVAKLPSERFTAPDHVEITFKKDWKGVASTSGDRVTCSATFFTQHPDDIGAIVHELVHVVQAYRRPVPGWLTEGIADYIRFYEYEPASRRPHLNPDRARYNGSYQTSAAFLHWAAQTYDRHLVPKLNAACRNGEYSDGLWQRYTGRSLAELEPAWKESLRKAEKNRGRR